MPKPLLRRLDQLAVAALTLLAIVSMALWWAVRATAPGGLVDIEHAKPLHYEFLVNVNQADWPELAQLPGIGEVLARRIVDSRVGAGPFRTANDLMRVEGIGVRKLAQMKRYLLPLPDDGMVAGP